MLIKRSVLSEVLEDLGDVMADNNILISIQNDDDFDLMLELDNKKDTLDWVSFFI